MRCRDALIVARQIGSEDWREAGPLSLVLVHGEYDDGLIELVTGRIEGGFALYRIPRRHPAGRRNYFATMIAGRKQDAAKACD